MKTLVWQNRLLVRIGLGLASCVVCLGGYAVTPAPDGGYAGNNTAEGTSALFGLTSGIDNTGLGFQALYHATTGNYNTGTGFRALFNNTTGSQNTASGINALSNDWRLQHGDGCASSLQQHYRL